LSTERGGLPELAGAPRREKRGIVSWLPLAVLVASALGLVALEWQRGGSLRLSAVGAGGEVRAYLGAQRNAARLVRPGARAVVSDADGVRCTATLVDGALEAPVEALPPQLVGVAGFGHGTPLRLRLPEGCRFGEGQVIQVELPTASSTLRP
jgi:hypothetical protein